PCPSLPAPRPPTPPAQTLSFEGPLVFGPVPKPAGYVDPDTIDPIIFGPPPHPYDFIDPALEEPVIFGPLPRPATYIEPEDIDNLNSMEDDTILGGFHEETHAGPDDAPTTTADAAGRAEDPAFLTSLSAKIDKCMGRIDSLETELGTSKKIMGGAILTLVSRVKKLERTVKQLRTARLVGDAPATERDVDIQDDVDLEGLSRMASEALGHDHAAVPSEDMEEHEEEEVPLRRKSAGRHAVESLGGGTGVRVGRGGRGRRPREGNDERVDDLNGQGNDQGMGANRGVEGVNGNVEGANRGAPDFSTIIAQQLQNLLPAMLAHVF
ncbi:hypothetical protein Tco_1532684, partial [Tanacetum coccineum]